MIIAVDGPAASGKGTLAKRLAAHYGLAYLDTGRTYRAVAADLIAAGHSFDDVAAATEAARDLDLAALIDRDLGSSEIGDGASRVAVHAPLRALLVDRQRAFARDAEAVGAGAVLDGRDIGTVVCPDAPLKFFITAEAEERARRRALELFGVAEGPDFAALLTGLKTRDARDASRAVGPLRPAVDAVEIDTTHLSVDAAFRAAAAIVDRCLNGRG